MVRRKRLCWRSGRGLLGIFFMGWGKEREEIDLDVIVLLRRLGRGMLVLLVVDGRSGRERDEPPAL